MKTAIELIAEERARQISVEGWTPEHDDKHMAGEIAMAAVCYAMVPYVRDSAPPAGKTPVYRYWPWNRHWWKPCPDDRVRELVKAGALLAAEIDRIQRAANTKVTNSGDHFQLHFP